MYTYKASDRSIQWEQRLNCALVPHAMHPSFCHGRIRMGSESKLIQPRPTKSAGKVRPPKHSTKASAYRRSR